MPTSRHASNSSRIFAAGPNRVTSASQRSVRYFGISSVRPAAIAFDRAHLLPVTGFLPVIAVVGQERVMGHGPAQERLRLADIVRDAGADPVTDKEIRVGALL